jgi:hypothetical protein
LEDTLHGIAGTTKATGPTTARFYPRDVTRDLLSLWIQANPKKLDLVKRFAVAAVDAEGKDVPPTSSSASEFKTAREQVSFLDQLFVLNLQTALVSDMATAPSSASASPSPLAAAGSASGSRMEDMLSTVRDPQTMFNQLVPFVSSPVQSLPVLLVSIRQSLLPLLGASDENVVSRALAGTIRDEFLDAYGSTQAEWYDRHIEPFMQEALRFPTADLSLAPAGSFAGRVEAPLLAIGGSESKAAVGAAAAASLGRSRPSPAPPQTLASLYGGGGGDFDESLTPIADDDDDDDDEP